MSNQEYDARCYVAYVPLYLCISVTFLISISGPHCWTIQTVWLCSKSLSLLLRASKALLWSFTLRCLLMSDPQLWGNSLCNWSLCRFAWFVGRRCWSAFPRAKLRALEFLLQVWIYHLYYLSSKYIAFGPFRISYACIQGSSGSVGKLSRSSIVSKRPSIRGSVRTLETPYVAFWVHTFLVWRFGWSFDSLLSSGTSYICL